MTTHHMSLSTVQKPQLNVADPQNPRLQRFHRFRYFVHVHTCGRVDTCKYNLLSREVRRTQKIRDNSDEVKQHTFFDQTKKGSKQEICQEGLRLFYMKMPVLLKYLFT